MSRARTEELIQIAFSDEDDGFLPDAIAAAKCEIERRDINPTNLNGLLEDFEQIQSVEKNRKFERLSNTGIALFFIFGPAFMWSISAALILGARGYSKKKSDALKTILIGFAFYISFGVVTFFIIDIFEIR